MWLVILVRTGGLEPMRFVSFECNLLFLTVRYRRVTRMICLVSRNLLCHDHFIAIRVVSHGMKRGSWGPLSILASPRFSSAGACWRESNHTPPNADSLSFLKRCLNKVSALKAVVAIHLSLNDIFLLTQTKDMVGLLPLSKQFGVIRKTAPWLHSRCQLNPLRASGLV